MTMSQQTSCVKTTEEEKQTSIMLRSRCEDGNRINLEFDVKPIVVGLNQTEHNTEYDCYVFTVCTLNATNKEKQLQQLNVGFKKK